jgi:hypothetical protein
MSVVRVCIPAFKTGWLACVKRNSVRVAQLCEKGGCSGAMGPDVHKGIVVHVIS